MIAPDAARSFACELLQAMADNDDIAVRAYFLGVPHRLDRDLVAARALGIAGSALRELAQLDGAKSSPDSLAGDRAPSPHTPSDQGKRGRISVRTYTLTT